MPEAEGGHGLEPVASMPILFEGGGFGGGIGDMWVLERGVQVGNGDLGDTEDTDNMEDIMEDTEDMENTKDMENT